MPVKFNDRVTYYRTAEACHIAGISKNTFLRWVREGTFADVQFRDRRGWRLFTKNELNRLRAEVTTVQGKRIVKKPRAIVSHMKTH